MKTDNLNNGYLSHGILAKIYRIIDSVGYKLFTSKKLKIEGNNLLFINLGLIGDLILFRYCIEDFIQLDYKITILVQDNYKFLFNNLVNKHNIKIITIKNYKDKKIVIGFFKIYQALKQTKQLFDASFHFRGYLGTGILSTYITGVSKNLIGYTTSGFGFLLNKTVVWQENAHETIHILNILRVIIADYSKINLQVFDYLVHTDNNLLANFDLNNRKYMVVHPTSQDSKKNMPQSTLTHIINYVLDSTRYIIVFVGSGSDELSYLRESIKSSTASDKLARIIITNTKITFLDIYRLLAKSSLFIGIDSSIAHLSSGIDNLPKLIVWHSQNILAQWKPLGNKVVVLEDMNDCDIIINKIKEGISL